MLSRLDSGANDTRMMAAGLDHFSDRLVAGARTELLALAKITFIKSRTACVSSPQIATPHLQFHSRVFWENGFRTIATIANADPMELLPVLMQVRWNMIPYLTIAD